MELLLPLNENDEQTKAKYQQEQQGEYQIAFWCLFAAAYLALFLFNVSMLGFQIANGSIDAAEATTSLVFSGAGLAVAIGLFLWNTCLRPTSRAWMLFGLFGLTAFGRSALLFLRHEWAFSFLFGLGSFSILWLTLCSRNVLASIDMDGPVEKSIDLDRPVWKSALFV